MSALSFPETDLGAVNHTGVCTWGSERGARGGGCADGVGTSGFVRVFGAAGMCCLKWAPALRDLGRVSCHLGWAIQSSPREEGKRKRGGGGRERDRVVKHKNLESNRSVSHLLHFLVCDRQVT